MGEIDLLACKDYNIFVGGDSKHLYYLAFENVDHLVFAVWYLRSVNTRRLGVL